MKNFAIVESMGSRGPFLSVELFPPKDAVAERQFQETVTLLKEFIQPAYVSITYGAGGSTREQTFRYACLLKDRYGFNVLPHLTCVGASQKEIVEAVSGYAREGFCNLMALRGDPPKGAAHFNPHPDGPRFASDLVKLLNTVFPHLCLGVAGYPEKHPEASDQGSDMEHLAYKVQQGASFITTQLFYNNARFHNFAGRCRELGIDVPIVPGLMPLFSASAARRFCQDLPEPLNEKLAAAGDDRAAIETVGVDWAYEQIKDLLARGVPGVHLYIMNKSNMILPLVERLRANGIL